MVKPWEQHTVVFLRRAVNISSNSSRRCHLMKTCSFFKLFGTKNPETMRITSFFNIMHDMPRMITCTTSSVLRLLVVYHRCGM